MEGTPWPNLKKQQLERGDGGEVFWWRLQLGEATRQREHDREMGDRRKASSITWSLKGEGVGSGTDATMQMHDFSEQVNTTQLFFSLEVHSFPFGFHNTTFS